MLLVKEISSAIINNDKPPIFLFGAGISISSGVPNCYELLKKIHKNAEFDIKDPEETDKFLGRCIENNQFTGYIYDSLANCVPSIGYNYVESLVREGFIDILLTLNFDSLLEDSIQRSCGSKLFRSYDCVSLRSEYIKKIINYKRPACKLLKLHGDFYNKTFVFSEKQKAQIRKKMSGILFSIFKERDLVIVGTQVADFNVQEFIPDEHCSIWYVTPTGRVNSSSALWSKMRATNNSDKIIKSNFDDFIREIYLEIRKRQLENEETSAIQKVIGCVNETTKFDRRITRDDLERLELNICSIIGERANEACVLYIHDPKAPGGSEIRKRFRILKKRFPNLEQHNINIKSDTHRWVKRVAYSNLTNDDDLRLVIIVDSIAFSGKTFQVVTDEIITKFPNAVIHWAPLLHSTQTENLAKKYGIVKISSIGTTKNNTMWFPWGKTSATGPMKNMYKLRKLDDIICSSEMRPWGTMHQFVHDQKCTVRILELKAENKTSLHIHYNRDEFFVALDDNVGIEYYGNCDYGSADLDSVMLTKGAYMMIPAGAPHRIFASSGDARILELTKHYYDQKYDIKRLLDIYGRVNKLGDE